MGKKTSPAVGIIIVLLVAAVAAYLIWKYTSAPTTVKRPTERPGRVAPAATERRGGAEMEGQRRGERRGGRTGARRPAGG